MSEDMNKKLESLENQKTVLEQTYQRVLGAIEFAKSCIENAGKPDTKKDDKKKKERKKIDNADR